MRISKREELSLSKGEQAALRLARLRTAKAEADKRKQDFMNPIKII
jgi:hypothetical protein